jgi:hypothetical protein
MWTLKDSDIAEREEHKGYLAVVAYDFEGYNNDDPRSWDNVGTMFCWHRDYHLGDGGSWDGPNKNERRKFEGGEDALDYMLGGALSDLDNVKDDKMNDLWNNYAELIRRATTEERRQFLVSERDEKDEALSKKYAAKKQKLIKDALIVLPLYLYDHSGITMSTGSFGCPWDSGQVGLIVCTKARAVKEWGGKSKRYTKAVQEKAIACLEAEVEVYDAHIRGNYVLACAVDPDTMEVYGSLCGVLIVDHKEDMKHALDEARNLVDDHVSQYGERLDAVLEGDED